MGSSFASKIHENIGETGSKPAEQKTLRGRHSRERPGSGFGLGRFVFQPTE
jgi:hypothetical protein